MITDEECLASRSSRLALSEASSATINDSKVVVKSTHFLKKGRALPRPGTSFEETWDE
jgi:hypothetical protein